jgi:hypothetical protein
MNVDLETFGGWSELMMCKFRTDKEMVNLDDGAIKMTGGQSGCLKV